MKLRFRLSGALSAGLVAAVLAVACGGGESPAPTPAPLLTPTAPRPVATSSVPSTSAPRPAPTTAPPPASPTQIPGKRGGTLQLGGGYNGGLDMVSSSGGSSFPVLSALFNNLIVDDPYNPQALVGDAAESWQIGGNGSVITFKVRRGIKFHDGTPMTSKDIAYNIDRAWKPRTPTMIGFVGKLDALSKIETPDESTVQLTLARPSNYLMKALSTVRFQIYPSHFPMEEPPKADQFLKAPVGTGPYKFQSWEAGTKAEYVRNPEYWKPNLPYADGITFYTLGGTQATAAAFRAGKLDATGLDYIFLNDLREIMEKEHGFVTYPMVISVYMLQVNQRPPFNDTRVRQAYSLAIDRHGYVDLFTKGNGSPYASPMMPQKMGGQWGIPEAQMKDRPGFRQEKAQDLAAAKQLLAQAGINPATFNLTIVWGGNPVIAEFADSALRALGFKSSIAPDTTLVGIERARRGDFDVHVEGNAPSTDDPLDHLAPLYLTKGPINHGKWTDPKLDALFAEADAALDPETRRQKLLALQESILQLNWTIPVAWIGGWAGHHKWVKNYPGKLPLLLSQRYRWEQVWLER